MKISVFHIIWCEPQALVINSFQQEQLLPWRNNCPSLSLETKNIVLEVLLVLTKISSTVCGCTVFLVVFTLVGFKTVPVGVLIFAYVAKQGGSWIEHTWHTSVVLAMPSWEESVKLRPLLENKKYVLQMRIHGKWNKRLVLINEAEKASKQKKTSFLSLL